MAANDDTDPAAGGLPWHPALAFAVTGIRMDDLGRQQRPDVPALAREILLRSPDGQTGLAARVAERRAQGEPWPFPIPEDLGSRLGAAQRYAAFAQLIELLRLDLPPSRTVVDRPLDADDRRLLNDVPPHHGH